MAQPTVTTYTVGAGLPINGGWWPGGRVGGGVTLHATAVAGSMTINDSLLSGGVVLVDAAVAGTLAGGGWGAGADVGSVASNVWTPGRDAGGAINQASVDALPANTWVKLAGSSLQTLVTAIEATGFLFTTHDWSNGKDIREAFSAWVGAADDGRRIYVPRGGGHANSSLNGVFSFDMILGVWEVQRPPSRPDAVGAAWSSSYDIPPNGTYTGYTAALATDDGLYRDILPDGAPTSAHTYNGVWYDSTRHAVGTGRVSKWVFDLTTKTWTRARWTWNGGAATTFTINQHWYYHAGRDSIYGFPGQTDTDYFSFGKCSAGTSAWVGLSGPANWEQNALSSCRIDADRFAYFWYSAGAERFGIYNMSTQAWESGAGNAITAGKTLTYNSELMTAIYIPTWGASGQVIRRGTADGLSGQWWVFDIATTSNVAHTPAGVAPPGVYGNKYRHMPGLGIAVAIDDASAISNPAIYVMRYA